MTQTFAILAAGLLAAQSQEIPVVQVEYTPVVSSSSEACCGDSTQNWEWSTTTSGGGLFHGNGGDFLSGLRFRLQSLFSHASPYYQEEMAGCCGDDASSPTPVMGDAPGIQEPPLGTQSQPQAMPSGSPQANPITPRQAMPSGPNQVNPMPPVTTDPLPPLQPE